MLDCLFPLEGWVEESQWLVKKTRYWLKLQGRCLSKSENQGDTVPHKGRMTMLEDREWEVSTLPKGFGIKPSKKAKDKNKKEIELYFTDKEMQERWFSRLKRVCMNEATHGIEIQSMEIDNAITQEHFQKRRNTESDKDGKGNGNLTCLCGTLLASTTVTTITITFCPPEQCSWCCGE